MGSPTVDIKVVRARGQNHRDMAAAVEALLRVNIDELPVELASYFGEKFASEVDFDGPGTLLSASFADYEDALPDGIEFRPTSPNDMSVGVRIDLEKLTDGARFVDVTLSY